MTAVEYFFNELQRMQYFIGNDMLEAYKQANKMFEQQIIDAFDEGQEYEYQVFVNSAPRFFSDTYYNETYGSKGSDEEKTNSQRFDEFMQLVTSSQTEISDEEIEKAFTDASERLSEYKEGLIDGAKWYREQLKLK